MSGTDGGNSTSGVSRAVLPLWIILAGKVVTLLGATAQTIGVVTFFAFDSLVPYRWPLIIGGTLLIAASEFALYRYAKSLQREGNFGDDAASS